MMIPNNVHTFIIILYRRKSTNPTLICFSFSTFIEFIYIVTIYAIWQVGTFQIQLISFVDTKVLDWLLVWVVRSVI